MRALPVASVARQARLAAPLCALVAAATIAIACHAAADRMTAVDAEASLDTTLVVPASIQSFLLDTYDGSGQAVHPDYAAPIRPWSHKPRYLAITPYPNGDTKYENPVLYSGADGMHWTVANGTPNPLAYPQSGYLSDPDVVYANVHNALYLYYRQASDSDYIHLIRSSNGTTWSPPLRVVAAPVTAALSPAVVRRAYGDWFMWTVNSDGGCRAPSATVELRRSTDGISWTDPEQVKMDLHGYSAWHIDVQWIASRSEFWALMPVKTYGTCATRQLFIASSRDGVDWITAPNAVARAGETAELRDVVYRSTFAYDSAADAVTLWLSGARLVGDGFVWSTAAVRRPRESLFSPVRRSAMLTPGERRREVDELFVPPA